MTAPASGPSFAALLTPGASAGPDSPSLVALDFALTAIGGRVVRAGLPVGEGTRAGRPPAAVEAVATAAAPLFALGVPVFLGGRSRGGRMCSLAAAGGLPAAGLVLVSYPLHPPGRPEKLRTEHFPLLEVPCLFVSGTRDAFATPDELSRETARIPGPVTIELVDKGDHGLRGGDAQVAELVIDWVSSVLRPPG